VAKQEEKIRVLLADDHTIFRQGLRTLLEAEDDLEIVGEAATGLDAVNLTRTLTPDIIVMDIGMPKLNGLQATQRIMNEHRRSRVIVLSMS
jgi:DNA-binding NarL/FixJ family response regulator